MDFEPEQYIPLCCATVELHRPYELPRPSVVNLSQCISKHMRRPVCQVLASEENFSSSEAPAAPVDGEEIDANVGACGGPQHVFSHRRVSSSDVCSACPLWLVEASYAARSREVEVLIGRRPDTPSQARLELWVDLGRLRFGEDLSCTLKQTLALLALHLHPLRIGEQPALRSSPCGVYDCKHHQPSDHDSLASLYDSVEKESLQKSLSTLSDEIFFSAFLRNPGLPSSSLDQLPQAVLLRLLNFLSRDDMQRLRCCSTFLYRELTRAVPGLTTKDMSKSIDRSSPEMLKVSNYKRLTQGFHKAELYAHQQHSLLQMQRVEKARVGPFAPLGADLTSFWTEFPVPLPRESETSRFLLICISSRLESFQLGGDWASMSAFSLYLCASTGVLQIGMSSELIPKPAFVWPSGGFLCDDPGLGKTLSILSLVAKDCSVDMTTPAFAAYRTVVLPPEVFTHPGPFTMDDLLNVNESLSACPAKGLVCLYPQPAARPAANALWNPVLDVSVYTDIQAALKPSGRPSAVARVMKSLAPSPTDRWMAESWSKFTAYQDQQQKGETRMGM
ncbi:MAG: hypothetical protein KVP17_003258 [Porospora cf. gigantea B]|uniref:uncharacterized protein n=1 Tax=Porospora cf. gigantea B TaxID=2853592 RepID=UPI003571A2FA|nr:MAG: hypothetical protein KVP17_003258 [Porospora cf. gigantea B]